MVACRVRAQLQPQDPHWEAFPSSQQAPQVSTSTCPAVGGIHTPSRWAGNWLVGWVRLRQGAPRGGGLSLLLLPHQNMAWETPLHPLACFSPPPWPPGSPQEVMGL